VYRWPPRLVRVLADLVNQAPRAIPERY